MPRPEATCVAIDVVRNDVVDLAPDTLDYASAARRQSYLNPYMIVDEALPEAFVHCEVPNGLARCD